MDLPRLHCKGVVGAAGFLEAIILFFMNNERIIEQNSVLLNLGRHLATLLAEASMSFANVSWGIAITPCATHYHLVQA